MIIIIIFCLCFIGCCIFGFRRQCCEQEVEVYHTGYEETVVVEETVVHHNDRGKGHGINRHDSASSDEAVYPPGVNPGSTPSAYPPGHNPHSSAPGFPNQTGG